MYGPSPEKVKVVKQLSRPEIVFGLARKPRTGPHLLRRLGLHGLGSSTSTRTSPSRRSWAVMRAT